MSVKTFFCYVIRSTPFGHVSLKLCMQPFCFLCNAVRLCDFSVTWPEKNALAESVIFLLTSHCFWRKTACTRKKAERRLRQGKRAFLGKSNERPFYIFSNVIWNFFANKSVIFRGKKLNTENFSSFFKMQVF